MLKFSLLQDFFNHDLVRAVPSQGVVLYAWLASQQRTTHPHGIWDMGDSFRKRVPLEKSDLAFALESLEKHGFAVVDYGANLIYLPGATLERKAIPAQVKQARQWIQKLKLLPRTPIKLMWATEFALSLDAYGAGQSAVEAKSRMINFLDNAQSIANSTDEKKFVYLSANDLASTTSYDRKSWHDLCSIYIILSSRVLSILKSDTQDSKLLVEKYLDNRIFRVYSKSLYLQCNRIILFLENIREYDEPQKNVSKEKSVLLRIAELYEKSYQRKYEIQWTIELGLVRRMLKTWDEDEIVGRFEAYLRDDWVRENGGHDIFRFSKNANRYLPEEKSFTKQDMDWYWKLVEKQKASKG